MSRLPRACYHRPTMRTLLVALAALPLLAAPAFAGGPKKATPAYVDQVRATVDEHLGDMVPCMEASKPKNGAKVKLPVQVLITSDGTVSAAKRGPKAKGSDATIEACMLGKLRAWRFPAPPDRQTVIVEFPIELEYAK